MRRAILALLAVYLAIPVAARADTNLTATRNAAAIIYFELRDAEGSTPGLDLEASASCATGDVKLIKDDAAAANATNCFTDATLGTYALSLTAGELDGKVTSVVVVDQTGTKVWVDKVVNIYTYGDASAFHGVPDVNVASISTDSTAADNLEAMLDGTGGTTLTTAITGSITGSLSGSVGSVTGNVGGSVGSLGAQAKLDVNAEADTALTDYDAPTNAELNARTLVSASYFDPAADAVADCSVSELQASALADLFNTDSGTTYASAVAGSVVKETADNAGGSALTEGGIADAVWDEALSGHTSAGTAGKNLSDASSGGSGSGSIKD